MKEITVAELRQNPTAALRDVEAGEAYVVTRHRRPIARLVPVAMSSSAPLTPARQRGPARLSERSRDELHSYEDTESLLAELAPDW